MSHHGAGRDGRRLERLCARAEKAVNGGDNIIDSVRPQSATSTSIAIPGPAGDGCGAPPPDPQGTDARRLGWSSNRRAREVHQFAALAGYGAEAINPYLAFETLAEMHSNMYFPQRGG